MYRVCRSYPGFNLIPAAHPKYLYSGLPNAHENGQTLGQTCHAQSIWVAIARTMFGVVKVPSISACIWIFLLIVATCWPKKMTPIWLAGSRVHPHAIGSALRALHPRAFLLLSLVAVVLEAHGNDWPIVMSTYHTQSQKTTQRYPNS